MKSDLIKEIKSFPSRYIYSELFSCKINKYNISESFSVSNYPLFIKELLSFLLEKSLTENDEDSNLFPRFYKIAGEKRKIFTTVILKIMFIDNEKINTEIYQLKNTLFRYEKNNKKYIEKIYQTLLKKNKERENIIVNFVFEEKQSVFDYYIEKKEYLNSFLARSDLKFYYTFIKRNKIDLTKSYKFNSIKKNHRLEGMCFNGEPLFFKKIIEKELMIDATKHIFKNYLNKNESLWSFDKLNNSVLNMARQLDNKSFKVMEEDFLILSLFSSKDWIMFYEVESDIYLDKLRRNIINDEIEVKNRSQKLDSLKYEKIIEAIRNEVLKEICNYIISNRLKDESEIFLKILKFNIENGFHISDIDTIKNYNQLLIEINKFLYVDYGIINYDMWKFIFNCSLKKEIYDEKNKSYIKSIINCLENDDSNNSLSVFGDTPIQIIFIDEDLDIILHNYIISIYESFFDKNDNFKVLTRVKLNENILKIKKPLNILIKDKQEFLFNCDLISKFNDLLIERFLNTNSFNNINSYEIKYLRFISEKNWEVLNFDGLIYDDIRKEENVKKNIVFFNMLNKFTTPIINEVLLSSKISLLSLKKENNRNVVKKKI